MSEDHLIALLEELDKEVKDQIIFKEFIRRLLEKGILAGRHINDKNAFCVADTLYGLSKAIGDYRTDDKKAQLFVDELKSSKFEGAIEKKGVKDSNDVILILLGNHPWLWASTEKKEYKEYPCRYSVSYIGWDTIVIEIPDGPIKGKYLISLNGKQKLMISVLQDDSSLPKPGEAMLTEERTYLAEEWKKTSKKSKLLALSRWQYKKDTKRIEELTGFLNLENDPEVAAAGKRVLDVLEKERQEKLDQIETIFKSGPEKHLLKELMPLSYDHVIRDAWLKGLREIRARRENKPPAPDLIRGSPAEIGLEKKPETSGKDIAAYGFRDDVSESLGIFLKSWRMKPLSDVRGELAWIGRILDQRDGLIASAKAQLDAQRSKRFNEALDELIRLVSDDPKRIRDELLSEYPFLGLAHNIRGPVVQEYYMRFIEKVFENIHITDEDLKSYMRGTVIDWIEGNPSILFNPAQNRALVAGCRAVMSKGLIDQLKSRAVSGEIMEVMSLVKDAEVTLHELEHVATGAMRAYYGRGRVCDSALNLVWEGLTKIKTAGNLSKLIGVGLADALPLLQDEELGFVFDSMDARYFGEEECCKTADKETGNRIEDHILETVSYGLRQSSYKFEDLLPCRNIVELNNEYDRLRSALADIKKNIESQASDLDQEKLIINLKAPLSRITSTYKMELKESELGKNALSILVEFLKALNEGNIRSLEDGFFARFLDEHNGHVAG